MDSGEVHLNGLPLGMADIRDKVKEHQLRMLGQMMIRGEEDLVGAILGLKVQDRRGRGRSKVDLGTGGDGRYDGVQDR